MIFNNRILRILQHKPYNSDTIDLYLAYNTLPIDKLFQLQILSHSGVARDYAARGGSPKMPPPKKILTSKTGDDLFFLLISLKFSHFLPFKTGDDLFLDQLEF